MIELIKKYRVIIIVVLVLIAAIVIHHHIKKSSTTEGKLAKCLKNKGAKFYGASWCGHCNSQKAMFGDSASLLPYIECSNTAPGQPQSKKCNAAGVKGYPTWVFADGTTQSGELSFDQLKQFSGC